MAENQNPNTNAENQPRTNAYDQVEYNPNDAEFAMENPNFSNPLATNNLQPEDEEKSDKNDHETKDARGGNHNPEGASGYTSGRVDDRGRKSVSKKMEHKDDRGRKNPPNDPPVGFTNDDNEQSGVESDKDRNGQLG